MYRTVQATGGVVTNLQATKVSYDISTNFRQSYTYIKKFYKFHTTTHYNKNSTNYGILHYVEIIISGSNHTKV